MQVQFKSSVTTKFCKSFRALRFLHKSRIFLAHYYFNLILHRILTVFSEKAMLNSFVQSLSDDSMRATAGVSTSLFNTIYTRFCGEKTSIDQRYRCFPMCRSFFSVFCVFPCADTSCITSSITLKPTPLIGIFRYCRKLQIFEVIAKRCIDVSVFSQPACGPCCNAPGKSAGIRPTRSLTCFRARSGR
jgi:hypothetical protein